MTPVDALQETLAAEHTAVHALAVLGGRLSVAESPAGAELLRSAYDVHRARRDQLRNRVAALGGTPVTPAISYEVDARDRSPEHLLSVARVTEGRCAEVYAQQVAGTTGKDRHWAVTALTDSAVRVLTLGGEATAFPGLPELA